MIHQTLHAVNSFNNAVRGRVQGLPWPKDGVCRRHASPQWGVVLEVIHSVGVIQQSVMVPEVELGEMNAHERAVMQYRDGILDHKQLFLRNFKPDAESINESITNAFGW
jgi:hypothetical protein